MYKVVVDSEELLISLADFKEFARVTSSVASDDLLMESLLLASIDYCEKYTGLSIATKTYERIYKNKNSNGYYDVPWMLILGGVRLRNNIYC